MCRLCPEPAHCPRYKVKLQVKAGFVGHHEPGSCVRCPHHVCGHCIGMDRERASSRGSAKAGEVPRKPESGDLSANDPEVMSRPAVTDPREAPAGRAHIAPDGRRQRVLAECIELAGRFPRVSEAAKCGGEDPWQRPPSRLCREVGELAAGDKSTFDRSSTGTDSGPPVDATLQKQAYPHGYPRPWTRGLKNGSQKLRHLPIGSSPRGWRP
jgi:hypothetical protein